MQSAATTLNLAAIVRHNANLSPHNEAVVWDTMRLTYRELDELSNRVANALVEMGIGHGDNVALNCPNLPFFPIVYYAIMKVGAAVVPLCVLFKADELEYHLRDSEAKAVFVFEGSSDLPLLAETKKAFDRVDTCATLVVLTK
ncbi:MAG: AMP-binding protein, partial [Blastocatellia bacterium]|nr:AMP-binding protein [Blastocatellia bacterium]